METGSGEPLSEAGELVKYFLQSGHVHVFDGEMYFDAPWLCKPIAMMTQNWYTIVDSLLKVCPFNVDRPSDCKSMLAVLTVLVLQFGADRFAANKRALSWLFGTIATTLPPPRLAALRTLLEPRLRARQVALLRDQGRGESCSGLLAVGQD